MLKINFVVDNGILAREMISKSPTDFEIAFIIQYSMKRKKKL